MFDFTLDPDNDTGLFEPSTRQIRLVSGLPDLAAVPASSRTKEHPACYAPCESCGAMTLTGETPSGQRVALDTDVRTYVVLWPNQAAAPVAYASRAYPIHRCHS